jgi:Ca2+-binding EF-hand superfamily protein
VRLTQFKTCLNTLQLALTEAEVQALLAKYSRGQGLYDYASFCANIDAVFGPEGNQAAAIHQSKSEALFSPEQQQRLVAVLETIRREVRNKRILIKPRLQDFDKTRSCHISSEQFRRVLKETGLLPPDEEDFQLVVRKYLDKGDLSQVNYVLFCREVDLPEDIAPAYRPKNPQPEPVVLHGQRREAGSTFYEGPTAGLDVISNRFSEQAVNKANDPFSVKERIRALVVMNRLRIEEYFRDFDKLRKGRVTRTQFESVLSALKVQLSKEEFDALFAQFATEDGFFNHAEFCASINRAFTDPSLQKAPLSQVAPVTVDSTKVARKNYLATTQEEGAMLSQLLREYRSAVQIKGLYLKPMFQNFDRTRSQHVTKHQFLRVLSTLGVYTEERKLNALLKAYLDKGNTEEVNYADFCEDVDSSE